MNTLPPLISFTGNEFNAKLFSNFCVENGPRYQNAEPFPSICMDNFFDSKFLQRVVDEFPALETMNIEHGGKSVHVKGHISDIDRMGFCTQKLVEFMNSATFLKNLEVLTGISALIPDPYLSGGGLHCTANGGFLKVHADFNYHPKFKLNRRLNILLYLNEVWDTTWGGAIELWSRDMGRKVQSFDPLLGRMVIFNTDSDTFHGHPDPMELPDDIVRKSIALYYYTNGREENSRLLSPSDQHGTLYRPRPGEIFRRLESKITAKSEAKKERVATLQKRKEGKKESLSMLGRVKRLIKGLFV